MICKKGRKRSGRAQPLLSPTTVALPPCLTSYVGAESPPCPSPGPAQSATTPCPLRRPLLHSPAYVLPLAETYTPTPCAQRASSSYSPAYTDPSASVTTRRDLASAGAGAGAGAGAAEAGCQFWALPHDSAPRAALAARGWPLSAGGAHLARPQGPKRRRVRHRTPSGRLRALGVRGGQSADHRNLQGNEPSGHLLAGLKHRASRLAQLVPLLD